MDPDVARSSKDIQRIELKPNTQISSTERLVTKRSEETLERTKFDRDTLDQEKHDNVTDPTSSGRPICGHESTERCVLTRKHVDRDQTSTGRPVTVDQKEEHNIDFRVLGPSHSVVQETEHIRVQELVNNGSKIILIEQHFKPTCSRITSTIRFSEQFEGDDPRIGQCGVIRVVRNNTKITMFPMSSLLESRNCVLHLRTVLDLQRIQKKVFQTKTGCNLYPGQRDQERRYPWCSTRQDRSTKRIPYGLECVEEML